MHGLELMRSAHCLCLPARAIGLRLTSSSKSAASLRRSDLTRIHFDTSCAPILRTRVRIPWRWSSYRLNSKYEDTASPETVMAYLRESSSDAESSLTGRPARRSSPVR
eukprot:scaffold129781_cov33-Tisochrysis_lutea.AAC.6